MKYILRIYDSELDRLLKASYEESKEHFSSMNAYLTELVRTGLNSSPVSQCEEKTVDLLSQVIDTLVLGFKKNQEDNQILTKLLSSVYALALSKNEEGYLSKQKVEEGFYDDLPKRFEAK